jgi:hypothetical protein
MTEERKEPHELHDGREVHRKGETTVSFGRNAPPKFKAWLLNLVEEIESEQKENCNDH